MTLLAPHTLMRAVRMSSDGSMLERHGAAYRLAILVHGRSASKRSVPTW